jgi:soluble lytic murein transglycosylase
MRFPIRPFLAGLMLLAAHGARAQDANPLTAVKANRWADAQAAAARIADPVALKLVQYLRLRAQGAATAAEIAAFMRQNPDWPQQDALEQRRQQALAADPDDAAVLAQCAPLPSLAAALLRCAEATANAGRNQDATALARQAWIEAVSDAATETAFARRWTATITPEDQWRRFVRLAWTTDATAATRQVPRLSGDWRSAAEAWLAAKRDDPKTEALAAALPQALRTEAGLALDRARALRRAGSPQQAAAVLNATAPADRQPAFWAERNLLARRLVREGDARTAYAVAAAHGQTGDEQKAEAEFLAGFIALRLLKDPALAEPHFRRLSEMRAAITQGRAHYWLARTAAAAGRDARPEHRKAADWPTTFYGQLSALALGESPTARISALKDPSWTQEAAMAFTGHEVLRAAALLLAWGDHPRARAFLLRVDELAPIPAERALAAAFALRTGLPDGAVFIARRMGRDGIALPRLGWPAPYDPPAPPDPSFSLAVMRQESSFDIAAVSPSGARGLMQLMPPTAQGVAKKLGVPANVPELTSDAAHNIRLGTAYLQEVLTQFDNCLPLAAAAYNAGPARVGQWLSDNGDPRTGPVDMVDWIELIPISETRNYVQRVTENTVAYRAARNDPAPVLARVPWAR